MALIKCPECGKEISSAAVACPFCGNPMSSAIRCPNCQSTNVEKISTASKIGSVALVGIFAMGKVTKTYKCNACSYKW